MSRVWSERIVCGFLLRTEKGKETCSRAGELVYCRQEKECERTLITKLTDMPDIQQIFVPLPNSPLKNLNCYVIRTPEENLIVDTGFRRPECEAALWDGIRELELDLEHTSLFLSHLHSDHTGLAPQLASRGCRIYMNGIDYDYLTRTKSGGTWPYMEAYFVTEGFPTEDIPLQAQNNHGRLYEPETMFPIERVEDGTVLRPGGIEIRCVHVPGHTPGQTVLYLPEHEILFSADHILFDITPNIGVWRGVERSLADYLDSLRKIRTLSIRLTLPAHRGCHETVYERIDELLEHHRIRLEEIYCAVKAHPGASAYEIAAKICWSARGRPWSEFSPNQKWFAMSETLAHLIYLQDYECIRKEIKGKTAAYFAV